MTTPSTSVNHARAPLSIARRRLSPVANAPRARACPPAARVGPSAQLDPSRRREESGLAGRWRTPRLVDSRAVLGARPFEAAGLAEASSPWGVSIAAWLRAALRRCRALAERRRVAACASSRRAVACDAPAGARRAAWRARREQAETRVDLVERCEGAMVAEAPAPVARGAQPALGRLQERGAGARRASSARVPSARSREASSRRPRARSRRRSAAYCRVEGSRGARDSDGPHADRHPPPEDKNTDPATRSGPRAEGPTARQKAEAARQAPRMRPSRTRPSRGLGVGRVRRGDDGGVARAAQDDPPRPRAQRMTVFQYEVQPHCRRACELAKQALDVAIAELDTLDERAVRRPRR